MKKLVFPLVGIFAASAPAIGYAAGPSVISWNGFSLTVSAVTVAINGVVPDMPKAVMAKATKVCASNGKKPELQGDQKVPGRMRTDYFFICL
jgi:hypothetical protein